MTTESVTDTSIVSTRDREFRDRAYRVAFGVLKNREDAEDTTQEVLLKPWLKEQDIHPDALFSYISVAAQRRAIALLRYRRYREHLPLGDLNGVNNSSETSPLRVVELRELRRVVSTALEILPHRHQLLVKLHYYEGLSYPQISQLTGYPLGTISGGLNKGRATLRRLSQIQALR